MGQNFPRASLARYIASSDKPEKELSREVAAFLIENNKTSDLGSLMRDVTEIRSRADGIVELTARSAFPLSLSVKTEIEAVAKKQYGDVTEVIIHEVLDESVIGGVRLQFANASLDLTIQSKLHKLREAIT